MSKSMDLNFNIDKIYGKIAKENGTTAQDVKTEIENALEIGFGCPDPDVQDFWRQINRESEKPTLDDLILFVIASLRPDN